jgi:hypothetical protein
MVTGRFAISVGGAFSRHVLRVAASGAWRNQAAYTDAMAEGYREVVTEQLIGHERERSMLVEGLISGRLPTNVTAWDALRLLGLPQSGHVVVVAIDSSAPGHASMQRTERALAAARFPSAWRLEPDMQVGLVALASPGDLVRLGRAMTTDEVRRAGPLGEAPTLPADALSYAKAALLAATDDDPVVIFDTDPYAVAATTDRHVMARYRSLVLGTLGELEPEAKQLLVDTFRTWVDCGGSIPATAEALICHPNTVRYRLRQLRHRTGRDPLRPRDVAELHLAIEADRRLR